MKKISNSLLTLTLVITGFGISVGSVFAAPENLIPNASVEVIGINGSPEGWKKGGWGTNNRSLSFPVPGHESGSAVKVEISSYVSGDAKWYFDSIPVAPGQSYVFSDYYMSDVASSAAVQFKMNDGSFTYLTLAQGTSPEAWSQLSGQFTVPQNAVSLTVFHVIAQVGYLITDDFSLTLTSGQMWFHPYSENVLENGMYATNVLGQSNFTSSNIATTQSGMGLYPWAVVHDADNNRLFVADQGNNRVLIYDVSGITNGEAAINVLGQPDFNSRVRATTKTGMFSPQSLAYDSERQYLFVSDGGNRRVLVYDVSDITNGEAAIHVLGQPGYTTNSRATTASGFASPSGLAFDSTAKRLFVADSSHFRALIFNVEVIVDGESAVNVLGQKDFTSSVFATTREGMGAPVSIEYDEVHSRLFVTDGNNYRVLVFSVRSITDGQPAINVLGQTNFTSSVPVTSQAGLNGPLDTAYDPVHERLFVADSGCRVVVYDVNQITDGEPAVNVIGQTTFNSNAILDTTQSTMNTPMGVDYDEVDDRLFVTDGYNSRVLVFNLNANTGNLVPNPNLEEAGNGGNPKNWQKGGWGSNTRVYSYAVYGPQRDKATRVEITKYTNGDAKWYFDAVEVVPGRTYYFENNYAANVPSIVAAQFKMTDGTYTYVKIADGFDTGGGWTRTQENITVPQGATSLTVFHYIRGVGYLSTDNFSLKLVNP